MKEKQPGESIAIVPGYETQENTFENALYGFLEGQLNAEEMDKIEIKITSGENVDNGAGYAKPIKWK